MKTISISLFVVALSLSGAYSFSAGARQQSSSIEEEKEMICKLYDKLTDMFIQSASSGNSADRIKVVHTYNILRILLGAASTLPEKTESFDKIDRAWLSEVESNAGCTWWTRLVNYLT